MYSQQIIKTLAVFSLSEAAGGFAAARLTGAFYFPIPVFP